MTFSKTCSTVVVGLCLSACSGSDDAGLGPGTGGSAGAGGGSGGVATGGSAGSSGGAAGSAGSSGGTGGGAGVAGCGPKAGAALLLHTTLDDAVSVLTPAAGDGTGALINTTPANDFHGGQCGSAIQIDANDELVRFAQATPTKQNFDFSKGTLDFWFQPSFSASDGVDHLLFSTGSLQGGGMRLRKAGSSNKDHLQLIVLDTTGKVHESQVAPADTPMTAGTWLRITVTWDFALTGQAARIYFDGVEAKYSTANGSDVINGPLTMPQTQPARSLFIGAFDAAGNQANAGGLIDDFKVYGDVVVP